jgi:hypothetical protein
VGEHAHAFHVVVELLPRERLDHRRNVSQGPVACFFGEVHVDLKLHFAFHRRRVEQNLVRRNDPA